MSVNKRICCEPLHTTIRYLLCYAATCVDVMPQHSAYFAVDFNTIRSSRHQTVDIRVQIFAVQQHTMRGGRE